jgi:uncharacterized protein (TIGR02271 family)
MSADPHPDDVIRSEEELEVGHRVSEAGAAKVRKQVDHYEVEQTVPRDVEHADAERTGPLDDEDGEVRTLPDGSLSIPVFEEQLVIEKRLVVRERIVVRKHTVTEQQRVTADLRRERVEIEVDDDIAGRIDPAPRS